MAAEKKSRHRLEHKESSSLMPVKLATLSKGDVFVRQGTPCMRVDVSDPDTALLVPPGERLNPTDARVWIINLHTGSVWTVSGQEDVYPAYDVKLTFTSARRGD